MSTAAAPSSNSAPAAPIVVTHSVKFPSAELATVAHRSLSVDDELRPERVTRALAVEGDTLTITVTGADPRFVRVAVSSLLDAAALTAKTMAVFA